MSELIKTKTGGRQAGTPNKLTSQTRQLLHNALAGEIERLPDTLAQLEPRERIEAVSKLMKYILPTMESIDSRKADKLDLRDESELVNELNQENWFEGFSGA